MQTTFRHLPQVQGWLNENALLFTSFYKDNFLSSEVFDSLEIGVFHGKFFIGIENLTPRYGRCIAIDCFSHQESNIDGAGLGDLSIFTDNCQQFASDPKRVIAIEMDSLNINAKDLGIGKFGIVSIDGCHTQFHTLNDLSAARDLVSQQGVVILDDITNQDWMGVVSGASQFFSSGQNGNLIPFAIGFNKLFCCHADFMELVTQTIFEKTEFLLANQIRPTKWTEFMGYKVVSLHSDV